MGRPAARGAPEGLRSRFGRNITSCGQAAMRMISNHIVHSRESLQRHFLKLHVRNLHGDEQVRAERRRQEPGFAAHHEQRQAGSDGYRGVRDGQEITARALTIAGDPPRSRTGG